MPTHRNCVMSATEAPILLGHICSEWRTISLSTPILWASLHIVEPPRPGSLHIGRNAAFNDKVAQRLKITEMWLGRSGECPLSISLQGAMENRFQPTATADFMQVLIPFAPRWQHIHFTIPPSLIFGFVWNIHIDMPWLRSVTFHCGGMLRRERTTRGIFKMLERARPSSLSIPCGLFATVGRCALEWNQLTTLTIGGPEVSEIECTSEMILPVISKCSELRSCKLLLCDPSSGTSGQEHPIAELPFLHSLIIRCSGSSSVNPIVSILLKHLSLPQLRKFALLAFRGQDANCPTLIDFLARSIRLEHFDITDNTFLTPPLHDILRSLPTTLHRLRIRGISPSQNPSQRRADDAALEILATSALRHLIIEQGGDITDAAILQFVTARMLIPGPSTLQYVEIRFHRDMTVDIMPGLQPFLETGLDVSLKYPATPPLRSSPWEGLNDHPDASTSARARKQLAVNYW
ncbi:hypothetical protein C8R45DRAFT_1022386 [Mycena sanguinolenta]|nr:hypothetical protein C8R45DRAFT_1022386 [Mycena sanguinolenta]